MQKQKFPGNLLDFVFSKQDIIQVSPLNSYVVVFQLRNSLDPLCNR